MEERNERIVIYHHNDLDGYGSAAVILMDYPDARLIEVNHGNEYEKINTEKVDKVFVVDFSFDESYMDILADSGKLIWIDHHKSAMERLQHLWEAPEIAGIRAIDRSGCVLTWQYMNPSLTSEDIPIILLHIQDMDIWNWEMTNSEEIIATLSLYVRCPNDLLDYMRDDKLTDILIDAGEILVEDRMKRVEHLFDGGHECTFFGYKAYMCNSPVDHSYLGNYTCSEGYDISIVWSVTDKKVKVSLCSIKEDIDVSNIAKQLGGGGHFHAAGFETTLTELHNMIQN